MSDLEEQKACPNALVDRLKAARTCLEQNDGLIWQGWLQNLAMVVSQQGSRPMQKFFWEALELLLRPCYLQHLQRSTWTGRNYL